MTGYVLTFAPAVVDDFDRISDHLFRSYILFGEPPGSAADHAVLRVGELREFIRSLTATPHGGTRRDDLFTGLRILSDRQRAVIAFTINDVEMTIRILRVFYGGEDYDVLMRDDGNDL